MFELAALAMFLGLVVATLLVYVLGRGHDGGGVMTDYQAHYEASQEALGEVMHELAGARKEIKELETLLREAPNPEIANVPLGAHALPYMMIDILRVYLQAHKDWSAKKDKLLEGKEEE